MYFQFVVDSKSKKIVSAEALSRWDNPEKGIIGPYNYIGSMESEGIISKHDFHMFQLACRQLEKWSTTEYKDISISCNFTRITLSEEDFIENLKSISQKYSFDKSKLAIEITEDTMENDREIAKRNVILCKQLGFKVYLDDLGSGYTSLSNLCDYPIDIVKIDRDILLKTDTESGKALFCWIISLAHSLNIGVICEGVETVEQLYHRAGQFIAYLRENYSGKRILAVGHGAFNRAIQVWINGQPPFDMLELPIMSNATVERFEI
jgi:EAL domain-containing protein (putative c-di-GMP-specific phosphodiesterase class I)